MKFSKQNIQAELCQLRNSLCANVSPRQGQHLITYYTMSMIGSTDVQRTKNILG